MYRKKYKDFCSIRISEHLRKQGKKTIKKTIARFRCGNKELNNKFWQNQERIFCRIFRKEEEILKHLSLSARCRGEIKNHIGIAQILSEKGEGIS